MSRKHFNQIFALARTHSPLSDEQEDFINTINEREYATQYDVNQFEELLASYDLVLRPNPEDIEDEFFEDRSGIITLTAQKRGETLFLVQDYDILTLSEAMIKARQFEQQGYDVSLAENEEVFYEGKSNASILQ